MTAPSPDHATPFGFAALLTALPDFAQDEFRRRFAIAAPPDTVAGLFAAAHGWLIGAGIAEGRGGYPGRRGTPGWGDYVAEQRRSIAVFRALIVAFGEPEASLMASLHDYERSFPAPVRLMGEGWAPQVEDVAGRLIYSFPVESGFLTLSFSFPITSADLTVLLAEPYRRAALEAVGHQVLQDSTLPGAREVTELDFRALLNRLLHSPADALAAYLDGFARDHNIAITRYVDEALARLQPAG